MFRIHFRQCQNERCRFRFPVTTPEMLGEICPRCGTKTAVVAEAAHQRPAETTAVSNTPPVSALLDNIRSVFNVGAMFRTADGAGLHHLYLCGITCTPEHPKLAKTSLGAEQHVPWTYSPNGVDTAVSLKNNGYQLWAIEGTPHARPLFQLPPPPHTHPILLIVGNERAGTDPDILAICDHTFWIPMHGQKESLNVAVAFGIAAYVIRHHLQQATQP